jgi:hypothetical protein
VIKLIFLKLLTKAKHWASLFVKRLGERDRLPTDPITIWSETYDQTIKRLDDLLKDASNNSAPKD